MNEISITRKFLELGARFKVTEEKNPRRISAQTYSLNIRKDEEGEYFELNTSGSLRPKLNVQVLQTQAARKHLLLLVQKPGEKEKERFLCGQDERQWFVAAVPGNASTVIQAMEALKPSVVTEAQARKGLAMRQAQRRHNKAFIRQGEWFFLPAPELVVDPKLILHREPIRRGGGKPHLVEELYRTGGVTVHVCQRHPNGVSPEDYRKIIEQDPKAQLWRWRVMRRDARVYARGRIRHRDHKTLRLHDWHRVLMNTETETNTMRFVAFLD